jgi:hypothetical protein
MVPLTEVELTRYRLANRIARPIRAVKPRMVNQERVAAYDQSDWRVQLRSCNCA